NRAEAGPERLLRRRVVLVERLQPGFERAVPEVTTSEGLEGQQAEAHTDVVELEVALAAQVFVVDLPAVPALRREHERALLERLLGIEGPRRRRRCEQKREHRGHPAHSCRHGSIRTLNAAAFCIRSSAPWTPSSRIRCVTSPSGMMAPDSSASTACRMSSGVWWNAPTSVSSS